MNASVPVQKCRSCGAEIVWLRNAKTGKPAPINAKPVSGGNIRADFASGSYELVPKAVRTGPLRTNHFGDCPSAGQWGKKAEAAS